MGLAFTPHLSSPYHRASTCKRFVLCTCPGTWLTDKSHSRQSKRRWDARVTCRKNWINNKVLCARFFPKKHCRITSSEKTAGFLLKNKLNLTILGQAGLVILWVAGLAQARGAISRKILHSLTGQG